MDLPVFPFLHTPWNQCIKRLESSKRNTICTAHCPHEKIPHQALCWYRQWNAPDKLRYIHNLSYDFPNCPIVPPTHLSGPVCSVYPYRVSTLPSPEGQGWSHKPLLRPYSSQDALSILSIFKDLADLDCGDIHIAKQREHQQDEIGLSQLNNGFIQKFFYFI